MVELTGSKGDVCLMHPFVLHRVSGNPSGRARFISNPAVRLREPMNLDREDLGEFSAVEAAILRGLGVPRFAFKPTRPRSTIPFGGIGVRSLQQRREHLKELDKEKARLAKQGFLWDESYDAAQWGITREEIMAGVEPRGNAFVARKTGPKL